MITELKIGDYIEKSELDTKQKYNDVVEVFRQWGFGWKEGAKASFDVFDGDFRGQLSVAKDGIYLSIKNSRQLKRKLTYDQVMSLKSGLKSNSVSTVNRDIERPKKDGNKYHREIIGFCGTKVEVDIYRVLDAYKTGSASLDHAAKKILCAGIRGHKDFITDIDNAIESLQEAKALHFQKMDVR